MSKRKYTQSKRAEQQEQTRARIIEAAMALHEELGPANTTIKSVAEKAGVQRLTVYRHFPDEKSLFLACTTHWLELNPPPQTSSWQTIDDFRDRMRAVLLAFYRYFRRTEAMWLVSYRDVSQVAALQEPMKEFESYLGQVRDDLVKKCKLSGQEKIRLRITLAHALQFTTWRSLKHQQLNDDQIVEVVQCWAQGVGAR